MKPLHGGVQHLQGRPHEGHAAGVDPPAVEDEVLKPGARIEVGSCGVTRPAIEAAVEHGCCVVGLGDVCVGG